MTINLQIDEASCINSFRRNLLAEAIQLSRFLANDSHADDGRKQRCQLRLLELQQEIVRKFAHPIRREAYPVDAIPIAVRQAFVKAVALVTRYHELGGEAWKGTLSSPTLSKYSFETIPDGLISEATLAHLCKIFQIPAEDEEHIATLVETVDRQIAQQKQIIEAVLTDAGLIPDLNAAKSRAVVDLFHHLFGEIPMPVEAIDCIYTQTQIFFCIDYQDSQLCNPDCWNRLEVADRVKLQEFLESLDRSTFERFRHFPTFSFCDSAQMNPKWVEHLAALTGLTRFQITQALSCSVSILATQSAEKYLIHDIWGHNWQSVLTQFKSDYAILANCNEPLRGGKTAYTSDGPLTCRELFRIEGEQVTVDRDLACLFFHGEARQRLGLVFTHVIAEMMADVAEFKFVRDFPELIEQLPCSSVFKNVPTKLDLELSDLYFLFLQVLQPLLEVKLSGFEESVLESDVLADWAQLGYPVQSLELRSSLKGAIAQLFQIFVQEYNATYLPTITSKMGVFAKIVSNLLYLQNAVNELCTDPTIKTLSHFPFQELLLVFIGNYWSNDSYAEFWEVDDAICAPRSSEAIANDFLPCWQYLTLTIF